MAATVTYTRNGSENARSSSLSYQAYLEGVSVEQFVRELSRKGVKDPHSPFKATELKSGNVVAARRVRNKK